MPIAKTTQWPGVLRYLRKATVPDYAFLIRITIVVFHIFPQSLVFSLLLQALFISLQRSLRRTCFSPSQYQPVTTFIDLKSFLEVFP